MADKTCNVLFVCTGPPTGASLDKLAIQREIKHIGSRQFMTTHP